MKKRFNIILLLVLLMFTGLQSYGQRITEPTLKAIVKSAISYTDKKPIEKLYVQTDKPVYLSGDTLRLKAYLLSGDYRLPSALSGILYVELDNEAGKNVKRMMLPVNYGLAWADMALDTAEIKQGNYTLRAYTNWTRNFGEDYIFKKNITVSGHSGNPLLVNSLFKRDGDKVEAGLQLKQLGGRLLGFKDVELKLMSGKRNLSKDKLTTGGDGKLTFNFTLPQNNEPLSIKLLAAGNEELTIPIALNRADNTDIQFMPEGGALVGGLQTKVGVKAIGEDGKGVNITGIVFNIKGEEVGLINTTYKGMGSFEFTPDATETYTARFNGINKSFPLPVAKSSGTVLSVSTSHPDSLTLQVQTTQNSNTTYYLIGQARGVVCYAEPVNMNGTATKTISKRLFPTGIARFTLLNANQQPVNERIVFINHQDEMRFYIQANKNGYSTRDSISLAIDVTDKDGNPVQGSFSMAVTDNSQVKIDSLGSNMLTHLLLTSDLKGEIEEPNYYFTGSKATELDNLMLTQGWVGYDWKEMLSPESKVIVYQPEKEFVVSGTVTTAFGKPIEKAPMSLISKKPLMAADTLTDINGRFVFRDIWPVDTAIFKLQARNKKSKEYNVTIKMDEQSFPEFKANESVITPWYLNTDSALLNNAGSRIAEEKAWQNYNGSGNILNEVNIKAKKVVKGSKNLNGPGEADLVLDEQDMLKAGKKTLSELLREKIPDIKEYGVWTRCMNDRSSECVVPMSYVMNNKRVSLIFDGMDIDKFFFPDTSAISHGRMSTQQRFRLFAAERGALIKSYLDYYTAEDIVGVELMFQSKYNMVYAGNALPNANGRFETPNFDTHAYIEITTRSKQGPFMKVTPGTYLYKPLAFTLPKVFYSPKYTVNNKSTTPGTDLRSTLFWEPNIITDADGKATVSFYSADNIADYSVIIEGTDMNGQLGHKRSAIIITPISP